jgi:hypothetical protein
MTAQVKEIGRNAKMHRYVFRLFNISCVNEIVSRLLAILERIGERKRNVH